MLLLISAMSVRLLILALVCRTSFTAEQNTKCVTPDYEIGTCVPIDTCPELDEGVKNKNSTLSDIAMKSQCGFNSVPLVCCKSSTFANLTSIYDKFFVTLKPTMRPYFQENHVPDRTVCGLGKQNRPLSSGNQTKIGQFPWLAALIYIFNENDTSAGIRCGGTLIHHRFVLTAAHCMDSEELSLTHVLLGEFDYSTDPDCNSPHECADYVRRTTVEKQIPHPFYDIDTRNNDIALFRLTNEVVFSTYIRPICLPPLQLSIPKSNDLIMLVGWGRQNGTTVDQPLKLNVFLNSNEIDEEMLAPKNISTYLLVNTMGKVNNYQANPGGPLVQIYTDTDQLQMFQEGVLLQGSSTEHNFSASYIRLSRYIVWILRHLSGKYKS